jgi:hypothetical protein
LGSGESRILFADTLANPGRYRKLNSQTVTVAVTEGGIRIYDQSAGVASIYPNEQNLLVAIAKSEISLAEIRLLFRDAETAQEVLDTFNLINIDKRLASEDKTWRWIIMPDGGLALGKTLFHIAQKIPYRYLPISVCVRRNGVFLYQESLGRKILPEDASKFLYIAPRHVEPRYLVELFPAMTAAEITAVYRRNRRGLLRLLQT